MADNGTDQRQRCCRIRLNPADLAQLARHFDLKPSRVSPLPLLLTPPTALDGGRSVDEILDTARGDLLDHEIARCLDVVTRPDRVMSILCAGYSDANWHNPFKLYQSAQCAAGFTALHILAPGAFELQFPYSVSDIQAWLYLSMQSAIENTLGLFRVENLSYIELVVLLGIMDTFKRKHSASLLDWQAVDETLFHFDELKCVIAEAALNEDARWTLAALFRYLDRIGPRVGAPSSRLRLRMPTDAELRAALDAFEKRDLLSFPESEEVDAYAIGTTFQVMATTLFHWEDFAGIHDTRITAAGDGKREHEENMLAYFSCAATNWVIAADEPAADLSAGAPFAVFALGAGDLSQLLEDTIARPSAQLPDELYGPATGLVKAFPEGTKPCPECRVPIPEAEAVCAGCRRDEAPVADPAPASADPATCPACGAEREPDDRFCEACGADCTTPAAPAADSATCASCGAALEPGMRFCTECGAQAAPAAPPTCGRCGVKLEEGLKFCTECGAPTST